MSDSQNNEGPVAGAGSGLAEAEERSADRKQAAQGAGGAKKRMDKQPSGNRKPTSAGTRGGRSFFDVYKPGQGSYTRKGTAIGAGVLGLAGCQFLYEQLSVVRTEEAWTMWVHVGVPFLVAALFGLAVFWIVGVNRKACDFMIATEGEMKKVHWSSRKEIIGSTKVVIVFTFLMAAILFVVDLVFMSFFSGIGVLREAPSALEVLFGSGAA